MAKKKAKKVTVPVQGPNADAGNVFRSEPPKKGYNVYESDAFPEQPEGESSNPAAPY